MNNDRSRLQATVAMTFSPSQVSDPDSSLYWTGWKRRHWPAGIMRPGIRFYGFDTGARRFFALFEVTRGGSFTYRSKDEFSHNVRRLIGESPWHGARHWAAIPSAARGEPCTGLALRWRTIKRVDIDYPVRFPQLGFLRLPATAFTLSDTAPDEALFAEGQRRLRAHLRIERNPRLRERAVTYWRQQQKGALRCLVCRFDFEKRYGTLGSGFIEMHHDVPLSSRGSIT